MDPSDAAGFPLHGYLTRVGLEADVAERGGVVDRGLVTQVVDAQHAAIAFENLDIHRGIAVSAEPARIVERLVVGRRGGICYELNGLLLCALRALGVPAWGVGAQVVGEHRLGPPLGHMAVLAQLDDEDWLLDVGFGGDKVCRPIDIADADARRVEVGAGAYVLEPLRRDLIDFEAMAWWHSTSPASRFTGSLICSLVIDGARHTLTGADAPGTYRLAVTDDQGRTETVLDAESALSVARTAFGLDIDRLPRQATGGVALTGE